MPGVWATTTRKPRCLQADSDTRKSMLAGPRSEEVGFAHDSALEEAGFEPSVPLYILTVSDPLLVGPVTVPFAKRKSPVRDRVPSVRRLLPPPSIPGHRLGALRWRVTGVA
jgi:hypothetical protein